MNLPKPRGRQVIPDWLKPRCPLCHGYLSSFRQGACFTCKRQDAVHRIERRLTDGKDKTKKE